MNKSASSSIIDLNYLDKITLPGFLGNSKVKKRNLFLSKNTRKVKAENNSSTPEICPECQTKIWDGGECPNCE